MTEKKRKIVSNLLCLVLGVVIGAGSYFVADKLQTKNNPEQPLNNIIADEDAFLTDGESCGMALMSTKIMSSDYAAYSVSEQAETSYLLTATVYPSTAVAQLDWSAEFTDSTSGWAKDKDIADYLIVTPTSDGALSATATVLQPFGKQIVIKATARGNTAIYAICTADYAKRFTTAELTFASTAFTVCDDEMTGGNVLIPLYSFTASTPYWRDPESSGHESIYCLGLGTVEPEVVSSKIEIKASDAFLQRYRNAPYYSVNGMTSECLYNSWYTVTDTHGLIYADMIDALSKPFSNNTNWCNATDYEGFLQALSSYDDTDFYIRITATVRYGENTAEEIKEYPCKFFRGSEVFQASSLSMDRTSLIY